METQIAHLLLRRETESKFNQTARVYLLTPTPSDARVPGADGSAPRVLNCYPGLVQVTDPPSARSRARKETKARFEAKPSKV